MLNSKALAKIQTFAIVAVIVIAAVGGSTTYVLINNADLTTDIKIGVCADLDNFSGREVWQAAILAAEEVNAEGGVLGRNFTVVAEDDDDETLPVDASVSSNAMTKLITVDKADFVISNGGSMVAFPHQDICSEHKKIMFGVKTGLDNYTQRVLDDYDAYKYFFKFGLSNMSTISKGMLGDILTARNYTGFNKIAFIGQESSTAKQILSNLNKSLPKYGFEIVYTAFVPVTITDFTSNFAAAEAAGAEILIPWIFTQASVSFVKEWYDRQSPSLVWGLLLSLAEDSNFWDLTEGKCEYVSFSGSPAAVGYPLTNKTVPTREAYFARWGRIPTMYGVAVYDGIRFILPDAIKRAGTTETEAVIKALEKTNIETSTARHFVFTSSHDIMVGSDQPNNPAEDFVVVCIFQWQADRKVVPLKPTEFMKEAGATFLYPPWKGPWSG